MNKDMDIWWSAYLAALAGGRIGTTLIIEMADLALRDYKAKERAMRRDRKTGDK